MTNWERAAYTRRQWIFSVNLIALIPSCLILFAQATRSFSIAVEILPFTLLVAFGIAWIFLAFPLSVAMRKPASYLRAAVWGLAFSSAIAFVGFCGARLLANGQLGAGEYMQLDDGVLTDYGWQRVIIRNLVFVTFGTSIALIVRAIIGPGANQNELT